MLCPLQLPLASQYFGLLTNAAIPIIAPLLAIEFDIGQNPEFNDPYGNHISIDLNNNLLVFQLSSSSSSLSNGAVVGIAIGCVVVVLVLASGIYLYQVAGCEFGSGREERERDRNGGGDGRLEWGGVESGGL
ncbi:hypothetical protein CerSpe_239890 [Prunus speciosa]